METTLSIRLIFLRLLLDFNAAVHYFTGQKILRRIVVFSNSRERGLIHQPLIVTLVLIALILIMIPREGVLRRKRIVKLIGIEEIMKGTPRMVNMTAKIWMGDNVSENLSQGRWRVLVLTHTKGGLASLLRHTMIRMH